MALISGAKAFLEILKQEGADCIFGNPGTTELPLMDALQDQKEIRYFWALANYFGFQTQDHGVEYIKMLALKVQI